MTITYVDDTRKRVMQLGEYESKKWNQLGIENPNLDDILKFFGIDKDQRYKTNIGNNKLKLSNKPSTVDESYIRTGSKYVPLNK